ncbi:DUF2851 family protein [Flavobacterium okayamense]|uniref:DUF2851 domain-containing protein n=1 Tax=Flavobacterium okayamense TaxID=2830782 RepID=A0ABN6I1U0_9FLAO|nr:DUF2851 family protein [Flavobacterium okayamense]BCY28433.1 hypothetical protein KK2020170_13010 [Flavobacterium okayamense]
MRENVLHYLWLHKCYDVTNIYTTNNEKVEVLNSGQYLQSSGPDFFNAQLIINNQKWAGNVELHVKSSDWYLHHHEKDENYDNVILHVVWEHDVEVYRKDKTEIPVLELKNFIELETLSKIKRLFSKKSWINCEDSLSKVSDFTWFSWKEGLFLERLEIKSKLIYQVFENCDKDWEATFFILLAKNFGLNINGNTFFEIARSIPFTIVRKESFEIKQLESLFLGRANLLNKDFQDEYANELKKIWEYQKSKYNLTELKTIQVQFYKLRPDNFPTIRLAQLASLYVVSKNLFDRITRISTFEELKEIFNIQVSTYWQSHYNFDKVSKKRHVKLTNSFIELIAINSVVPIQFAYGKYNGKENLDEYLKLMYSLNAESNIIIKRFEEFGIEVKDAFDSQALLQLKNEYCNFQKCLKCKIGVELLQKS